MKLKPIIFGGGQQGGMRSGTENVPGIAGIAKAAQIMYDNYDQDIEKLYDLKKCFIEGVKKIDRVIVNDSLEEAVAEAEKTVAEFIG